MRLIDLMIYVMAFVFAWAFFSMLLFAVYALFLCLVFSECWQLPGVPFPVLLIVVIAGLAVVVAALLLVDKKKEKRNKEAGTVLTAERISENLRSLNTPWEDEKGEEDR